MMRRWIAVAGVMMVGAACSSEAEGTGASCADIAGNYTVKGERIGGDCPEPANADDQDTVSVVKGSDGRWSFAVPGVTGGCPGTLDASSCRFIANCEINAGNGQNVATFTLDYTFNGKTFTGTSVGGFKPPAVPAACRVTYRESGTRL